MPTSQPRHQVTETDELAAALDDAAKWWPELRRGQLITRLALEGHRAGAARQSQQRAARLASLMQHSGALTGAYSPGDIQAMQEEWPA